MDYNTIVSKLRELARDELRLKKVNAIRADRLCVQSALDSEIKDHEQSVANNAHSVAVTNFRISQINDADPDKDKKIESWSKDITLFAANLERENKNSADHVTAFTKQLTNIDAEIAKVQSGEFKVSMEALTEATDRLIKSVVKEAAQGVPLTEVAS